MARLRARGTWKEPRLASLYLSTRTRLCGPASALFGHAYVASCRNLFLMIQWAVGDFVSIVRRVRRTFSHSQVRHSAMTARTTTVRCSCAASVDISRAATAGRAAPACTAHSKDNCNGDTPTRPAPSPIPLGEPGGGMVGGGGKREWVPTVTCAAGAFLFLLVCHRHSDARRDCQCCTRSSLASKCFQEMMKMNARAWGSHHSANDKVDHDSLWLTVASEVRQPGALAPNCSAMSILRISARCMKNTQHV